MSNIYPFVDPSLLYGIIIASGLKSLNVGPNTTMSMVLEMDVAIVVPFVVV